ncbi:unnamed protein product [Coffea canephora]|uniref:AB hydrolase-1 domain-containing protein n=1 Tax=Coffea canephora TaxID=49390 RepID=A0A068TL93_COFCA|nr:unnamed protein product [Coffea canephora]
MSLYYPSFKESREIGQGVYKGKSSIDRYIGEHAVLLTGFDKEEDGTEVFEFKNTSGLAFGAQGFGKLKRDLIISISYPKGVLKVDKIDKDGIGHKYIMVRGLQIHVAEIGAGSSVVLFYYGFPEMWYSWRYQMLAVANKGFRAIVPDYQGYGVSEMPQEPEKTTFLRLVNDLFAVLRNMGISKVFLVAKGFGVQIASLFAIRHQEMVNGIITIGPPSIPGTQFSPFQNLSPKCYLSRWKDPQKAKDEFNCLDPKAIVRKIYILFSQDEIPETCDGENNLDLIDDSLCPSWITEDDLTFYGTWYERTGFSTALKVPLSLDENVKLVNQQIRVPALMIIAGKDHLLKFPGIHDYIQCERVNKFVSDLEMKYLPEGTHFVQEQLPDDVNEAILTVMSKHSLL